MVRSVVRVVRVLKVVRVTVYKDSQNASKKSSKGSGLTVKHRYNIKKISITYLLFGFLFLRFHILQISRGLPNVLFLCVVEFVF